MQQFLEAAIGKGLEPRKTAIDSVILRDGGAYRVLVGSAGTVTTASVTVFPRYDSAVSFIFIKVKAPIYEGEYYLLFCVY